MKRLVAYLASLVPLDWYQRFMTFPLMRREFKELRAVPVLRDRRAVWDLVIAECAAAGAPVTYVEFGVWKGESIRYFAEKIRSPESVFIGLDSFEGLPEQWGKLPPGQFGVGGEVPRVDDQRVRFIKGWFQDSWGEARAAIEQRPAGSLVVHFDADLYSSTLFALCQMDQFKQPYIAVFDEFTHRFMGHEARALYNYCQAYGASVTFLARAGQASSVLLPIQVACRITPKGER